MSRFYKLYVCIGIFLCLYQVSFSQSIYLGGSNYKYFPATQEPPIGWNSISFDDSQWANGYSVIGYGNKNDSTNIDTVNSLYIRMPFEIADIDVVSKMSLLADFDDGYIAYINGIEVVRVNLGDSGTVVPFDALASRSHESIFERNYCSPLLGYYLDSTLLQKCLIQGTNILSLQVHNDSINGSDLLLSFALFDISEQSYNPYNDENRAIKKVAIDSTHLPIVHITTNDLGIFNCNEKANVTIDIIHSFNGSYNKLTDIPNIYSGPSALEPRGQSSIGWPKKSYSIELRDPQGNDSSIAILGMPKESDWILSGPFADRSLIRNALAYTLSSQIGEYAPRSRFCDLFINDEYYGVYLIMEKIKRDKDRVDVEKLTASSTVDITGGYIMKLDKPSPGQLYVVYPKPEDITPAQKLYISTFYKNYMYSLHDSVILNPEKGFRKYVAVPSYLNFTIINELARNPDAYLYSTYMYKDSDDKGKKLHYGPVWDFDLAFGNSNFQNAGTIAGWQFAQSTNGYLYHKKLFKDTMLVRQFNERWFELRSTKLHNDTINAVIDSLLAVLGPAIERNKQVWQLENDYIMQVWNQRISLTYEEDVFKLKKWMVDRATWMDANISKIYYPYTYVKPTGIDDMSIENIDVQIYPNPCISNIQVAFVLKKSSEVRIEILNSLGQKVLQTQNDISQSGNFIQSLNVESLPKGTYAVTLFVNNILQHSNFIVKQ